MPLYSNLLEAPSNFNNASFTILISIPYALHNAIQHKLLNTLCNPVTLKVIVSFFSPL